MPSFEAASLAGIVKHSLSCSTVTASTMPRGGIVAATKVKVGTEWRQRIFSRQKQKHDDGYRVSILIKLSTDANMYSCTIFTVARNFLEAPIWGHPRNMFQACPSMDAAALSSQSLVPSRGAAGCSCIGNANLHICP